VVNREERARADVSTGGVFGPGTSLKPGAKPRGMLNLGAGFSERVEGQDGVKPVDSALTAPGDTAALAGGSGASGSGAGGKTVAGRRGELVDISTDDEPDEARRDIERIWISSDEDLDITTRVIKEGKQKVPSPHPTRIGTGLRPVRAPRSVKDEEVGRFENHKRSSNRAIKKSEPEAYDVDGDEMSIDEPEVVKEAPSSPELKKKSVKKHGGKSREVKPVAETIEERTERLRLLEDVQKLRKEFVGIPVKHDSTRTVAADMDDDRDNFEDGRLLLFQFPPLTPFLIDPGASAAHSDVGIKVENPTSTAAPSVVTASAPAASATASAPAPEIKKDPDALPPPSKPELQLDGLLTASEPTRLPSGYVGKLRIHRSGKVSLDWGGVDMEVRYGTEVDFLQDAVLVETPTTTYPQPQASTPGETGTVYALGPVKKKMVVIPDWGQLYD